MAVEILVRPDLGRKPYRLRCRFRIGPFPSRNSLDKAKFKAAEMFVRDMAKQGWEYVERHGFTMTGPYAAIEPTGLVKRSQQKPWHIPSRDLIAAVSAGYHFDAPCANGVKTVPSVDETDVWEFELAGVFTHETILTELPDEKETP